MKYQYTPAELTMAVKYLKECGLDTTEKCRRAGITPESLPKIIYAAKKSRRDYGPMTEMGARRVQNQDKIIEIQERKFRDGLIDEATLISNRKAYNRSRRKTARENLQDVLNEEAANRISAFGRSAIPSRMSRGIKQPASQKPTKKNPLTRVVNLFKRIQKNIHW